MSSAAKKKSKKSGKGSLESLPAQEVDERFTPLFTDPKFRLHGPPKKESTTTTPAASDKKQIKPTKATQSNKNKIEVDDRFQVMFEGKEFQSKPVLDRYGRKASSTTNKSGGKKSQDLDRHFTLSQQEETRLEKLNQLARGGGDDQSSSSSSEDEHRDALSSSSSNDDDDFDQDETVQFDMNEIAQLEMGSESSSRLACVGCDWDRVRAVDLLAVLSSFVPPTGAIVKVSIYPSQFGLERMKTEEMNGPSLPGGRVLLDDEDEEEDEVQKRVNPEILRKYERERLLYCVAVVECDSQETAEVIYRECDGLEFEHSSVALDLRFIPKDVKFDASTLMSSADEVPDEYLGPEEFVNNSLQQTNVKLTWDEPKHDRNKLIQWGIKPSTKSKGNTGVSLAELERFIASSDDDGEEDSEEEETNRVLAVKKYRDLLLASSATEPTREAEEDEDEEVIAVNTPSSSNNNKTKKKPLVKSTLEGEEEETPSKSTRKKKKGKKSSLQEQEDVEIDLNDARLESLLTDPEFMLDQTHPKFKQTKTTAKINQERRKRLKIGD